MEKTKNFFLNLNRFGILACKFDGIKNIILLQPLKKDLKVIIEIFEKVGFKVNSELVNLEDDQSKYYAIYVRKVSNE
jgi:hypothetical protein